ncbi:hypothetical protein AYL99_11119 [Fonsecaea erecta]|uniref:Uncharacterized protein n=1 Tax=Fonsecaea erecta TaxID=1367422 RepID=A0A178Z578_9EURO|nr:hypothetical protein AYL99_11119 [Fonsecaea erecta]OAP54671.1 hypothetical protein AYL99_11119 [Fonsecaea erecta]
MAPPSSDGPGTAPTGLEIAPVSAPEERSFFDFPYEVRLEIYEMLYSHSRMFHLKLDHDGRLRLRRVNNRAPDAEPVIPVHAFTVSKKFKNEASPILYLHNTFGMEWENLQSCLPKWDQSQRLSSSPRTIDICCKDGPAWGLVLATRLLVNKMPALREINFKFCCSYRLAAAALETSAAITRCAPVFQGLGPELELVVQRGKMPLSNPGPPGTDLDVIWKFIHKKSAELAGIAPKDLPSTIITEFCAPNLSLIKLSGGISRSLLAKILQYRCVPGHCAWKEAAPEVEDGLFHYKWQAIDPHERADIPEVNMRQWQPPLTARERQTVRACARAFEKRDTSCQDDKPPSGEHETAGDQDEVASEANALFNGNAESRDLELTDDGETSNGASSVGAEGNESGFPGKTKAARTTPATPEDRVRDLQVLAFADCFNELDFRGQRLQIPGRIRFCIRQLLYTFRRTFEQDQNQCPNSG